MCGLYGFLFYGAKGKQPKDLSDLVGALAEESAERGTDATGISYVSSKGRIVINKAPKSAYYFNPKIPKGVRAVMGHTRRTTQGNENVNGNNHPFPGKAGKQYFALAHNGVLYNESEVRMTEGLKVPKIETDSYVAVQLLEKYGKLEHESFKKLGETVEGMFAFTVLDNKGNLHIVRNDSPFHIMHIEALSLYVYASTKEILLKALARYEYTNECIFDALQNWYGIDIISPKEGSILTISNKGVMTDSTFTPVEETWGLNSEWWNSRKKIAGGSFATTTRKGGYTRITEHSDGINYQDNTKHLAGTSYLDDYYDRYYSEGYKLGDDDNETYMQVLLCELETKGYTQQDLQAMLDNGHSLDDVENALCDNTLIDLLYSQYGSSLMVAESATGYREDELIREANNEI